MATERASLGFGQRLVLLAAWLVSCGFVYVLGVYVGKGMHDRGPVNPGVSLPVDAAVPPAPPADAQAPLTFYDVLGTQQGAPPAARPAPGDAPAAARPAQPSTMNEQKLAAVPPTPPAPSVAAPPAATPPVVAKATMPAPPAAKPSPTATTPPARPAPGAPAVPPADGAIPPLTAVKPPVAAKPAPPPSVAPATPPAVPNPPAVPSPAASPVRAAPPAPTAPAPAAAGLPPQVASGRWTVYANPSRDQLAVEYERAALRAKGYPAEVVTMKRDGDTWYRIRVGRYATEAQAQEASRKLRSDGVGHAFVQSE